MRELQPVSQMLCAGVLVLSVLACAGGQKYTPPKSPFTSKADLDKIEAAPAPAELPTPKGVVVETWDLQGPFPSTVGRDRRVGNSPTDSLIASMATGRLEATEQMHCVAREVGAFYLKKGDGPAEDLKAFILERCGSLATDVGVYYTTWNKKDPSQTLDEAVASVQAKDGTQKFLGQLPGSGTYELGGWFGQNDKTAMVMVAVARKSLKLTPMRLHQPGASEITLEGEMDVSGFGFMAAVTRGDAGYTACATDRRVKMPKFRVVCPVDPTSKDEVIEMSMARRKDALMSSLLFRKRVWLAGTPETSYSTPEALQVLQSVAVPETLTPEQWPETFTTLVNALRAHHKLPALKHEPKQSASANKLAPHLLKAFSSNSEEEQRAGDKIMLGLIAGWNVQGDIIDGALRIHRLPRADPKMLLAALVESPSGRRTIYSPSAGALSMGNVFAGEGVASVVNVYDYLPKETHEQRVKKVLARMNRVRKTMGRRSIKRMPQFKSDAERVAGRLTRSELDPLQARDSLGQTVLNTLDASVQTYVIPVNDLDDFELPDELTARSFKKTAIAVAPYRHKGHPWMTYMILLAYPSSSVMAKQQDGPIAPLAGPKFQAVGF